MALRLLDSGAVNVDAKKPAGTASTPSSLQGFLCVLTDAHGGASNAAKAAATKALLRLLDGGEVDVNEMDASNRTPLHWACHQGLETVALP